jgi:hypothetical protein
MADGLRDLEVRGLAGKRFWQRESAGINSQQRVEGREESADGRDACTLLDFGGGGGMLEPKVQFFGVGAIAPERFGQVRQA